MLKYCVRCEEPIKEGRKKNKAYCSDDCHTATLYANNKNESTGAVDYKHHRNSVWEQGIDEGGLPWEVQHAIDLIEDSPRITEDVYYLNSCLEVLGQPKYQDGDNYYPKPGVKYSYQWKESPTIRTATIPRLHRSKKDES